MIIKFTKKTNKKTNKRHNAQTERDSRQATAHAARACCLCVLRTRWIAFDDGSLATIGIVCSAGLRYRVARELVPRKRCSLARAAAWLF